MRGPSGVNYQDGQPEQRFRWLHLRYETGRYYWIDGPFPHYQWYWDLGLFQLSRR